MPPNTSRDFQRAAGQRFTAAEYLAKGGFDLDAQYMGGYVVECSFKALILEKTPGADRVEKLRQITAGAKWHRLEVLKGELKDLGVELPLDLAKKLRHVKDWDTDLRHETGHRNPGITIAFLRTAKAIFDWVDGQLK